VLDTHVGTGARTRYVVVALRGELDVTNAAGIARILQAAVAPQLRIIVDLAELTFMDCSSLGGLLRVQRLARQGGGDVLLAAPAANVLRLLSLTCMDKAFGVHASVDAAVAGTEGSPQAVASRRAEPGGRSATGARVLSGSSG
jgi:anti-sigma B factor antagonist